MRIMADQSPFPPVPVPGFPLSDRDKTCRWLWHPQAHRGEMAVLAFRLVFDIAQAQRTVLHVSADQRYELFLDGQRLGRGPLRSDLEHWSFESYQLELDAGAHLLAARVWWLPSGDSPMAQMSGEPGFLVKAEGELAEALSTGSGNWQVGKLGRYGVSAYRPRHEAVGSYHVVGASFATDGFLLPWGWNTDPQCVAGWVAPTLGLPPIGQGNRYYDNDSVAGIRQHHLIPSTLPNMMERLLRAGRVRHAQMGAAESGQVAPDDHDPSLAQHWQSMLDGSGPVMVPSGQSIRLLIDLENYYCAYPQLVTSGGANGRVRIAWAESLYQSPEAGTRAKGNRDSIANKTFRGPGDAFVLDGGRHRLYDTLWWRSGRYVDVVVEAIDEEITIEELSWRETRYPLEMEGTFVCDAEEMTAIIPIMVRGLQMCAHETYMDCPYYEQLMYVGDTRLEALITHVITHDDRLPARANTLFDWSRAADGLTKSRYPSDVPQVIPPFSLWWVSMVHDYALWRDRPELVRNWLPGVAGVLSGMARYLGDDDLLAGVQGWNFCDWVPEWRSGWPPDSREGVSALINLQYLYALDRGAELHRFFGQTHLADHWRQIAQRLRQAIPATFWDESRGLLADDRAHAHYSEHVQALAILTQLLDGQQQQRLVRGLLHDDDLSRATIYFSHYLFEALRAIGRMDTLYDRLKLWFDLPMQGFKTTFESPEPSRSDCHAWGAHPLYHYYASFLGARPAEPGFRSLRVEPQFGPLTWLRGTMPHAAGGMIRFDLRRNGQRLDGEIELPHGLGGTLVWQGEEQMLEPGVNRIAR